MSTRYEVPFISGPTKQNVIDSKRPGMATGVEGKPAGVLVTFNMDCLQGQGRGAVEALLELAISAVLDNATNPLKE